VNETFDMFRNLTGENNLKQQGTRDGDAVKIHLNFPLFFAAINKARKPQDLNRVVMVDLEHVPRRTDPVNIILGQWGEKYITDLRADLAVGLLPHIPKLQAAYDEIEKEFAAPDSRPKVDTRFWEALQPSLAVMKFLGRDYRKFAFDFCATNKSTLVNTAESADSAQLFNQVCFTPKMKWRMGDKIRVDVDLMTMLATPEGRSAINSSSSGVFYDDPTQMVLVNWVTALQTVLTGSRFGRDTAIYSLRELANRSPYAMKPEEIEASGALDRLRPHGLIGLPTTNLTGYSVKHIIDLANKGAVIAAPTPPKSEETNDDDAQYGSG